MPTVIPNLDLTMNVYLLLSVVFVSISSSENQSIMEKLSNYTSEATGVAAIITGSSLTEATSPATLSIDAESLETSSSSLEQIDKLSDEKGSFIMANTICCAILILYRLVQYLVLGTLRVSEQQHSREAFWDYSIQKSLFLVFFLDSKSCFQDRSPWAVWFTTLGSILLLSKLCKDRFEYLSSSPSSKKGALIKISILMGLLLLLSTLCAAISFTIRSSSVALLLLADAAYMLIFVIAIITKFIILTYDMRTNSIWENRATMIYYSELFFEMVMCTIDLLHQSHLLIMGVWFWPIKFLPLLKIHTLIMEMRKRYRKHKNYLLVVHLMENNFALASQEELIKNSDDCAICWDAMESARKLPCGHLFHNSCLRSWLEQDTSCPTCRTSLKATQEDYEDTIEIEEEFIEAIQSTHQRNHLFHFDTSRYTNNQFLNWLPTISIEGWM